MRWRSVLLCALATLPVAMPSCTGTSEECVAYCAVVADRLADCDLIASEGEFDQEDCAARTSEVDADACSETADALEDASCDAVTEGFCPDELLACPNNCFGGCCVDADCPAELPTCVFGECKECSSDNPSHCPSQSCYLDECVECTEETASVACPPGEGCDFQRCRKACVDDSQCAQYSSCSGGNFCSEPVGTPCVEGDVGECGSGAFCETLSASGVPVDPFCSIGCSDAMECPDGYTCASDDLCRPL